MKNCTHCKHAVWQKTAAGRLHPSGDGECGYEVKLPAIASVDVLVRCPADSIGRPCQPAHGTARPLRALRAGRAMKPFDPSKVIFGDELAYARNTDIRMTFRGMGFDGMVIVRWVEPRTDRPRDALVRQRELLIVEPSDA